jgi:hypothetical protein
MSRGSLLPAFALLAAVVSRPSIVTGQFIALPDSNASWITNTYFGPDPVGSVAFYLEPFDHDTLINDTLFSALFSFDAWVGTAASFCGGLYDNGSGQVYYYNPPTGRSYLLYDFDVLLGDTIHQVWIGGCSYEGDYVQAMYADSVDTISINGVLRKRIGIQKASLGLPHGEINHWWVQGVGGTGGLLSTIGSSTVSYSDWLECMSTNDTTWWYAGGWGGGGPWGQPGECLALGLDEHAAQDGAWFHPTLTAETITLDNPPEQAAVIEVMTVEGRMVKRFAVVSRTISVAELPAGPYVLQLRDNSGKIKRGKFVKQ